MLKIKRNYVKINKKGLVMALSAAETQFNNQVENTPIVKEILGDLSGLKIGQKQLGDDMKALEKKVDNGFNHIIKSIDDLRDEIKDDKLAKVQNAYDTLIDEKKASKGNIDKVKNGSIISLIGTVLYFAIEKFGHYIG